MVPPDLSAVLGGGGGGSGGAPFYRCRVVGGRLLANRRSDEVFSEIRLDPSPSAAPTEEAAAAAWSGGGEGDEGGMAWFVKILTESDANCGGGFSVPSKFADSKRLISGDAIIFVKDKSNGDLFVGFRRALRLFDADSPFLPFLAEIDPEEDERTISELGFSRCVRGRIPSANVVEAARSADLGRPFEVLYYPKAGLPEFVVPEAEVDAAMRVPWKIAKRGAKSPWRMLQVTWDQPEIMKNRGLNKVSPWQVEIVSSNPALQTQYFETPRLTKWRVLEKSGSLGDEQNWRVLENSGFLGDERNSILNPEYKTVTSAVLQSPEHPAGMQGARQDLICFLPIKRNEVVGNSSSIDSTTQEVEIVRGEMNIANISHSSSIHLCQEAMLNGGSEPSSTSAFSQLKGVRTIALFGQTIIIEQSPAGGGADKQ
uniref:Uncharacterized protein n=1 Tax=Ananas comosus var. bracteatus TaxID=296719 RepID=A0A6V7PQ26_ANACO|nr:unnamed protein product [Ananas comosus var. bracteatus]